MHDDDPRFRTWKDLDAVDVGFDQLSVGEFDRGLLGQLLQSLELLFGPGPKFPFRGQPIGFRLSRGELGRQGIAFGLQVDQHLAQVIQPFERKIRQHAHGRLDAAVELFQFAFEIERAFRCGGGASTAFTKASIALFVVARS